MRKVFWENPYQTSLSTQVTAVDDNRILVADTIAFSFSGGQESDKAKINGWDVLDSEIQDQLIWYTLASEHGLQIGDIVFMEIDWPRRHKLMRLHFAAELVLELVTQQAGFEKIGAHISENKARIDFRSDNNISSLFEEILTNYNAIIASNQPIITAFSDEKNQRRYWQITGFAQVSCGGTHVKTTGEVGLIHLKRVNIGKGKERIEISLRFC